MEMKNNDKPRRKPCPDIVRDDVYLRYGCTCAACGCGDLDSLTVDRAYNKYGYDVVKYLVCLCNVCNCCIKKSVDDWLPPWPGKPVLYTTVYRRNRRAYRKRINALRKAQA